MSDEAVIVEGHGSLYIGGPPLVQAATGDKLTSEELGGAYVHCAISGCTDHFAKSEEEAIDITRCIMASLNLESCDESRDPPEPPLYGDSDSEFGLHEDSQQWNLREILARLLDGSRLHLFKEKFGPTLSTGFARVCRWVVCTCAEEVGHTSQVIGHFFHSCFANNY